SSAAKLFLIYSRRRDGRGGRLVVMSLGVVLDELLEIAVSPASVEVVLLHFGVNLFEVPVVMIEAVNRAHHARAVPAARAMYEKLSGRRIVDELQKLFDL